MTTQTAPPNSAVPSPGEQLDFLWKQHGYIADFIKLADAKSGFILSLNIGSSAMLISATTRFKSLLPEHLGQLSSATQVFAYAALFCIVCSVGFAAWAIYPRLKIGPEIGPISWVEISSFSKVELFVHASLELRSPKAVKLMARQVYYMSRVCRRKNRLIQIALSFMAVAWLISITLIAKA